MSALKLQEESAFNVLLVRAIESEDSAATILTSDDRCYATQAALATKPLTDRPRSRETAAFVARRAALALERLVSRYPAVDRVRSMSLWPPWISIGIPFAALMLGLMSNELNGQRLNLLAFPMLGMLVWNLAVYLTVVWHWVSHGLHGRRRTSHPLVERIDWLLRPAGGKLAAQPTLERALGRFADDWAAAAGPLTGARLTRTLHLGAAMFALGIVAGMILRARYTAEYTAGWAGTWAGAESEVHAILRIILGPASAVTGVALPSVERLKELRGGAENAGDWLKLWATAAALYVIVPRLALAGWSTARAGLLGKQVPIAEDFYLRSLLRNALGRAGVARVVPYGFEPSGEARERLLRVLAAALGEATIISIDPLVPYGDEDQWLEREAAQLTSSDQLILLFDMASTPEAENQGALVSGVRHAIAAAGTMVLVLVDESSFRRKLKGHGSLAKRVQERLNAWRLVLARTGVTPACIALDLPDETASARTIEQALLQQRATT